MIDLKKSKMLVTGAGGFIGSHLTEKFIKEASHVRALVRYNSRNHWGYLESLSQEKQGNVEVLMGDIADYGFVKSCVRGCDCVFHLAALIGIPFSYHAPEFYIKTNIVGTHNVLRACREEGVSKIVHTSTSEVYGTARYVPINEQHPLQGQSPYSATKIGADKIAESYFLSFGLPVAILRPFNTYGPRQSARAIVPTIISQLLNGPTVHLGSVGPVRDLTYVSDTVEAFAAIAKSNMSVGEVINVGCGEGISIEELASKIAGIIGIDEVKVVGDSRRVRPESSEVYRLICDSSKAKKLLGWEPRITIEEGLKLTVSYIRGNRHLYKPEMYVL
jgi:NAD dependent epimerase/dehydratase